MASYNPPVKNAEYIFYISLFDQSTNQVKTTPTIAAGDFKSSTDGGATSNMDTLPSESPAGSGQVKITVSATEMNGDNSSVIWIDASGDEWHSGIANIQPVASGQQFDDLSTFDDTSDTVDVGKISGDATAADNAESFFDGTGYAGTNNVMPTTTTVTNQVSADVTAVSGDSTAADNLELDYDGTGYAKANSTIGTTTTNTDMVAAAPTAVQNRTEMDSNSTQLTAIVADTNELQTDWADGGRLDLLLDSVITDIAALNDVSTAQVNAEMVDALNVDTYAESAGVPAATASLVAKIGWLATLARNKMTQDATTQTLRNDADGADVATSAISDDGTTLTRAEWT